MTFVVAKAGYERDHERLLFDLYDLFVVSVGIAISVIFRRSDHHSSVEFSDTFLLVFSGNATYRKGKR